MSTELFVGIICLGSGVIILGQLQESKLRSPEQPHASLLRKLIASVGIASTFIGGMLILIKVFTKLFD